MNLILGKYGDITSFEVIEWLTFFKEKTLLICTDIDSIRFCRIDINNKEVIFEINNKKINLLDIKSVWNRRFGFNPLYLLDEYLPEDFHSSLFWNKKHQKQSLLEEAKSLYNYLHFVVDKNSKTKLGSYSSNVINKLEVLSLAKDVGLNIPNTFIINNKKDLYKIYNNVSKQGGGLITKPIDECISFKKEGKNSTTYYFNYVEELTSSMIEDTPEYFFPSLIQYKIEKQYELRIFFIEKDFYPMAIFSNGEDAKIDYRSVTEEKILNKVPYDLPLCIKSKLQELMENLNLNTGSIDMIVDWYDNFFFLEVNPVGQLGMTSKPCNYYLEEKIAKYLMKNK